MTFGLLEVFLCFALACMLMLTAALVYYLLDGIAHRAKFLQEYKKLRQEEIERFSLNAAMASSSEKKRKTENWMRGELKETQKLWRKNRARENAAKNTKKN